MSGYFLALYIPLVFYYGFAFVWFSLGILNYIPDPRWGVAYVLLLLDIFDFIVPIVVIIYYTFLVLGRSEFKWLVWIYLIFDGLLRLKFIWYCIIFVACSQTDNLCSFVPSDLTKSDPTETQTWRVIFYWEFSELFVLIYYSILSFRAPDAAKEDTEKLIAKNEEQNDMNALESAAFARRAVEQESYLDYGPNYDNNLARQQTVSNRFLPIWNTTAPINRKPRSHPSNTQNVYQARSPVFFGKAKSQ